MLEDEAQGVPLKTGVLTHSLVNASDIAYSNGT